MTVEDRGELYVWSYAHTDGDTVGTMKLENITIRAGGKFEALTADGSGYNMMIQTTMFTVNGHGYFRTNELHLTTENLTVDLSGMVTGSGLNVKSYFIRVQHDLII